MAARKDDLPASLGPCTRTMSESTANARCSSGPNATAWRRMNLTAQPARSCARSALVADPRAVLADRRRARSGRRLLPTRRVRVLRAGRCREPPVRSVRAHARQRSAIRGVPVVVMRSCSMASRSSGFRNNGAKGVSPESSMRTMSSSPAAPSAPTASASCVTSARGEAQSAS